MCILRFIIPFPFCCIEVRNLEHNEVGLETRFFNLRFEV